MSIRGGQLRRARRLLGRARRFLRWNRLSRALVLARLVERRGRFVWHEGLRRDRQPRTWRLRSGVGSAVLRSGGRDLDIFEEIFLFGEYDLPPEVDRLLRSRAQVHVVDLGGNIGLFGLRMLEQLPGCTITSFEPDIQNLGLLAECIREAGAIERWSIRTEAAGVEPGSVEFLGGHEADSRMVGPGQGTHEVPVADVFGALGDCDLLKIDIEGGEWAILADRRLASTPLQAVVLEIHGYSRPSDDIRQAASELLGRAGFEVRHVGWNPIGVGRVWGWRSAATMARLPPAGDIT